MERFSRQQQPAQGRPQQSASTTPAPAKSTKNKPSFGSKLLVVVLIIAAVLITATLAVGVWASFNTKNLVKSDQYQAVFLDNGQVYFGKLSGLNNEFVELTDIYYLQVDQQIQPDQDDGTGAPQQQAQISLAKLGNELHGPEDIMYINPEKIVFWENLKGDGQVTTAISEYQSNQDNQDQ